MIECHGCGVLIYEGEGLYCEDCCEFGEEYDEASEYRRAERIEEVCGE